MFVETEWPLGVSVLGAPKDTPPSRRCCATAALSLAAQLARTPAVEAYACGFAAWAREVWHAQAARLARAFPLEHQAFSIVGEASALAAA